MTTCLKIYYLLSPEVRKVNLQYKPEKLKGQSVVTFGLNNDLSSAENTGVFFVKTVDSFFMREGKYFYGAIICQFCRANEIQRSDKFIICIIATTLRAVSRKCLCFLLDSNSNLIEI